MKNYEALAERARGRTIRSPKGMTFPAKDYVRADVLPGLLVADLNEDGWSVVEEKAVQRDCATCAKFKTCNDTRCPGCWVVGSGRDVCPHCAYSIVNSSGRCGSQCPEGEPMCLEENGFWKFKRFVPKKPECPKKKCEIYNPAYICDCSRSTDRSMDLPRNVDRYRPAKPKTKTEIWPVHFVHPWELRCYPPNASWCYLDVVPREPRLTGRYEFMLPGGEKILVSCPRLLWNTHDKRWSIPVALSSNEPLPQYLELFTPTGVEVLAE